MSENSIYEAAARGDERSLEELLEQDPLLLDRVSYSCSNKTPLHVATIQGHLALVRVILEHNPDLAQELDSQQTSALHIACMKGHLEIALELLSAVPDMCLSRDCQGRNPLHLAAMKGHVEVLEELVRVYPMAAQMKLDGGRTVLHLCVEYRQLVAFKMLVRSFNKMVYAKDDNGENVLHVAVRDRQIETINYLLSMDSLDVNRANLNGMTAADILTESTRDVRDSEIKESLRRALEGKQQNNLEILLKQQDKWLDKKRGSLMVVASLIATMSFQVGVNPPGGLWQDNNPSHNAGFSILAQNNPEGYADFYITNAICFLSSLSTILLLMSGLPLRRRFFIWVLMLFIWTAIITAAVVYVKSVMLITPIGPFSNNSFLGIHMVLVSMWYQLMFILVFGGHTIRLIVKLVKKLIKSVRRMAAAPAVLVNNAGV